METIVDEPFGDIQRPDSGRPLLPTRGQNELVLTSPVAEYIVRAFESFHQVVGVENGHVADLANSLASVASNVGEGAHHHSEVAVKCLHFSNRLWSVVVEVVLDGPVRFHSPRGHRNGRKVTGGRATPNRASPGARRPRGAC